jgi:hypothetical protein
MVDKNKLHVRYEAKWWFHSPQKMRLFQCESREAHKKSIHFPYFGLDLSIFVKIFEIYLVTESL